MLKVLDVSVFMAYLLVILSFLLCIIYGILFWNKDENISEEEVKEEVAWEKEEKDIEDELGRTI